MGYGNEVLRWFGFTENNVREMMKKDFTKKETMDILGCNRIGFWRFMREKFYIGCWECHLQKFKYKDVEGRTWVDYRWVCFADSIYAH